MSHLKILVELDYLEAVQVSRLIGAYVRLKTRNERCSVCDADLLLEPHHDGCSVAMTQRLLDQMDPPPKPTLWGLIRATVRKVAA